MWKLYIYQRAMNCIFHELDSKIVEIYIDDVVIKSKGYKLHLADLRRTLEFTRKHVNPNKYAYGISAGQLLSFLLHERGIGVGQKSVSAIDKTEATSNKKELRSLIGKINFIKRFISNLSKREFSRSHLC
jgi:hypothetical protein